MRKRPSWIKLALILAGAAALGAAWRWTPLAEYATVDNILDFTRAVRERWWAPLALVAAYTLGAFLLFPRPVLTLASVLTFGVWLGLAYATLGVLVAALASYGVGRALKRETVRRIAGEALDRAAQPVKRHGVVAIFGANMLPTPPFVVQNIVAGAIRIRLWEFMAGTALALVPGILAWTVFGDQLMNALEDASRANYWAMGAALALFAGFVYLSRRWLRARGW